MAVETDAGAGRERDILIRVNELCTLLDQGD